MRLRNITSVTDRWTKVKVEYSIKSAYAEVDMLTAFSEMHVSTVSKV